jgi:hypothetical protein
MYLVECYADELFLCNLLPNIANNIEHTGSRSKIIKKIDNGEGIYKALIDEDPDSKQDERLNSYSMSFANTFIKVYKAKGSIIVALRPRIEEFLLNIARAVNIDLKDYKLHIMVKNYIKILGNQRVKQNNNTKNFYK